MRNGEVKEDKEKEEEEESETKKNTYKKEGK